MVFTNFCIKTVAKLCHAIYIPFSCESADLVVRRAKCWQVCLYLYSNLLLIILFAIAPQIRIFYTIDCYHFMSFIEFTCLKYIECNKWYLNNKIFLTITNILPVS